jgi:hypothetical protein
MEVQVVAGPMYQELAEQELQGKAMRGVLQMRQLLLTLVAVVVAQV